jgi:hypothetical protein
MQQTGSRSENGYPGKLRLVRIRDAQYMLELTLLTNTQSLTASAIAQLYKAR